MRTLFIFLAILVASQALGQRSSEKAILEVLNKQADAWNAGDIEGYMEGYWNDDSLLFIGSKGPTYGYRNTLERYKNSYQDTVKMGKLHFSDVYMKRLSKEYYFVSGKWELNRSIGDLSGYFTLLFRNIKGKWFIVADHSS